MRLILKLSRKTIEYDLGLPSFATSRLFRRLFEWCDFFGCYVIDIVLQVGIKADYSRKTIPAHEIEVLSKLKGLFRQVPLGIVQHQDRPLKLVRMIPDRLTVSSGRSCMRLLRPTTTASAHPILR